MRTVCVLFCTVSAWAQSGLDRPEFGKMLDTQHSARPIFGISGSVTLGDPDRSGVVSLACASQRCLFKTETAIVSEDYTAAAPEGRALFALSRSMTLIYFASTRVCAEWKEGALEPLAIDIPGEVLALRVRSNGNIEFAVRRNHQTWIVDARNQTIDSIPPETGPMILLDDAAIYVSADEIVLRRDDGSEIRFPLEGVESFAAIGDGYVQARTRIASYAIHTARGRERMFQLPDPLPESTRR